MPSDPPNPRFDWQPDDGTIDIPALFGREAGAHAPLIVEIGSGNGVYLVAEAERHPETNYLGIERAGEFFEKFRKRIIRHNLANVRCMLADVEEVFADGLVPQSVDCVISNFSDPWPKRRHAKRRLFRPDFLPQFARVLKPGGSVRFKTDVGWYFNLAVTAFRESPEWKLTDIGLKPPPNIEAGEVVTNFERKAREAGSTIWGFTATVK